MTPDEALAAEAAELGMSVATLVRINELVAIAPPLPPERWARIGLLLKPRAGDPPVARAA